MDEGLPDPRDHLTEEQREAIHRWAEETALAQGLPRKVEDLQVLRDVLLLMGLIDWKGNRTEKFK